ncbi:hypothetical protein ACFSQ3_12945 [Sphingobacterium corticis]|uniref:Uncharacterized protein n=1 Tax=Sphingobacterium corticis TaxID=1812823 RepID=A0ABW5NLU8_9SPHI
MEPFLPKEYQYNIKAEKEQEGMFATNYEAIHPETDIAPFEIIVNEVPTSIMNIKDVVARFEETAANYGSDIQLHLLNKEDKQKTNRRLYKMSHELSTILMLMMEKGDRFTMIEVEFHPEDFETVSLERWQEAFWQVK